jgi:AcrR family transcriptional regulator
MAMKKVSGSRKTTLTPAGVERLPVRDRVLCAAFSSFMEKGYVGTSMLDVATRAKVSKREVYAVCADKSALLRETITERANQMRIPLKLQPVADHEQLEETLTAFGAAVLRGVSDKPVLAVYRLAIAEAANSPEVARALDRGRHENRAALGRTLLAAQRRGLIRSGDPAAMAVDFLGLLWGDLLLQLLLHVADQPSPRTIQRMAQRATRHFMNLYRSRACQEAT